VNQVKWPIKKLGALAEFRNGVNYNRSSFGEGIKVVGVSDFQNYTKPRYAELEQINPKGIVTERNILHDGDIVFVRSNGNRELIGRSLFIEQPPEEVTHSAFSIRLRFTSREVHPKFYAYCFRTPLIRQGLTACGGGTNISNLNQDILNALEVPLPPLPVQRRIADILSAYDELMENSQRRIRTLEAMARALYREWFVNFRFPGYEKLPRVASPLGDIPKGWEVFEFRYLFDIRYGKTLPKTEISDSGPYPVYGAGDVIGFYDKMLCPNKCALVTSRGNGSGTVWRTREAAFVTNNSLIMMPQEDRSHWDYSFVELLLKHANVMEAKTGSAQPQVTIENLNYVKTIVPTKPLVEKFCAIATPIYEQVDLLFRQIQNLRRTRDLLLPRLLSGQVVLKGKET